MRVLNVKWLRLAGAMLACLAAPYSAGADLAAAVFDDTKIYHYELQFYITDWADSLAYYKSLPDEDYIPARFLYRRGPGDTVVLDSIGVRYKGNSSYVFAGTSPKKPFKFKFDEYRDQEFYGLSRLNFSNGARDPSFMREKISYDVLRRYMPAPRAAYATITIGGELIGLYTQVEQVDKTFLKLYYVDNDLNLYKAGDDGATLLYLGEDQSAYEEYLELKTNETVNDWSGLIVMIDKLNNTSDADFRSALYSYLDFDRCVQYLAFNMVFSNFDSYTGSGRNYYLYDDMGRFTLIPWDLNLSFGDYSNNWNVNTQDIVSVSNLAQRPLNRRILENDVLRQAYFDAIAELLDGPACPESIAIEAERLEPFLDPWVQADSHKLHSYEDFLTNIETDVTLQQGPMRIVMPGIKSFAQKRSDNLKGQLENYLGIDDPVYGSTTDRGCFSYRYGPGQHQVVLSIYLRQEADIRLSLCDMTGTAIHDIAAGRRSRGTCRFTWNAAGREAGIYLIRIRIDETIFNEKLVLPRWPAAGAAGLLYGPGGGRYCDGKIIYMQTQ